MISTYASGIQTGTIGVENFLSSPNAQGKYVLQVDLSNMLAGDYTEIRRYKMAINSGTARAIDVVTYQGAQPTDLLIAVSDEVWNSLTDTNAVRFSLKQSLGTARAYSWSVLLDDALAPAVSGRTLGVDSNGKVSLSDPQNFNLIGNISGTITNVYNVISGTAGSDPWSTTVPGAYPVGTAGYILGNNLDVRVSSRMASGTVFVQDKTGFSLATPQNFNLIGNISGTLSNVLNVVNPVVAGVVTGSVLGNVNGSVNSVTSPVTVGTNNDKTGYSLSSPQNFDLIGNVSGTITNVYNVISGTTSTLDASQVWSYTGTRSLNGQQYWNLSGTILNVVNVTNPVTVGTNNDKSGYSLSSPQNFNLVGNISGTITNVYNVISGTTSGGDPLNNNVPGAYAPGTAGYVLGTNLDVLVSSRQPSGTVVVSSNQDKTGYSLATGTNLPVNVKQINDTNLQGNGSTTPWGPA